MTLRSGFALLLIAAASICAAEPLRVGTITIRSGNVFSDEEATHGGLYRIADKLHIETRTSVIRGFLLFKEGDPYDPARLAETERNLRALGFIRAASVTAGPAHDGVVDVTVRTEDAWSIEPGTNAGSKGGVNTFGMQITDSNLAGFGRQVSVSYDHGTDRSRAAIDYTDPAFFGPYRKARLTYAQNSDGFEHRLAIGRPFYSITTRNSTEIAFDEFLRMDRLYLGGITTSRLQHRHRQFSLAYGLATEATERSATRWTLGLRAVDDTFRDRAPSSQPPDERRFRYVFLAFHRVNNNFITRNFVDHDVRCQDYNLGRQLSLEAAVSPRAFGALRTTEFVRGSAEQGVAIDAQTFALGSLRFEGRIDRGLRNGILTGNLRFVHRFETTEPQTFVARLLLNNGWNLDRETQFFADGGVGLRGYRLHAFEGSRNLVVNLEQRLYLGRELLHLLSPGIVAFVDAGKATNNSLLDLTGFKSDAGIGLRIGLPRAPRNVIRIDVAYPLQPDPRGHRGVLVSFSSGQAF